MQKTGTALKDQSDDPSKYRLLKAHGIISMIK